MDVPNYFKIFPCRETLKTPATKNGLNDATDNVDQIALWRADGAKYNWAVNCGASNLFVVDIDPAGIDYWNDLLNRDEQIAAACSATYQVKTPRGGTHYYWKGEGRSTASEIAAGIDTRGKGGYVLLAGGQTTDGKYVEIGGDVQPLPDCITALLADKAIRGQHIATGIELDLPINIERAKLYLKNAVALDNIAIEGRGGNSHTYKIAATVLELGLSVDSAFDLLTKWNNHCVPPWPENELYILVQNAAQYGEETSIGGKAFEPSEQHFKDFVQKPVQEDDIKPKRKTARLLNILEARACFKPPHWLIPDYIPATGIGMIYGAPGSYKSFMAMDMALSLSAGLSAQWPVAPLKHHVIYLAGEGQSNFVHSRVTAWLAKWVPQADDAEISSYGFRIFEHGVPAHSNVEHWDAIRDGIDELGINPSLIIVDTMARLISGMDENSAKDATLITGFMESIANRYQCFVLGIHHTGKDVSKGARGSSAFLANMDSVFHAFKKDDLISLQVKKHRDADSNAKPKCFKVEKLNDDQFVIVETFSQTKKDIIVSIDWMSRGGIIEILQEHGLLGLVELSKLMEGKTGLKADTIRKRLKSNIDLDDLHVGDVWSIKEYDL